MPVSVLKAIRNLRREVGSRRVIQPPLLAQHQLQRLPFQQLHGDECDFVLHADVVNGDQIGVAQPPGRLRFPQESLPHVVQHVFRQARVQRLDRHRALDERVNRAIDRTCGAAPELTDDAVAAECFWEASRTGFRAVGEMAD